MTQKIPENEIVAKGSSPGKSRSNATKVELDLYYMYVNVKYKRTDALTLWYQQ